MTETNALNSIGPTPVPSERGLDPLGRTFSHSRISENELQPSFGGISVERVLTNALHEWVTMRSDLDKRIEALGKSSDTLRVQLLANSLHQYSEIASRAADAAQDCIRRLQQSVNV